ncbi:hypothetical protein IFM89_031908, partial [Coptis chinensis]
VDADQTKEIIRHKRKQPENSVNEIRSSALKRAQEVQVNLDPQFPNFVKNMLHSHVSSCFWLGIPLKFCKSYLPQEDETITLVAENGEQYPVKFLARKTGLSGGWRGFSLLHNLVEGDVLVFQLIMATKFKVYIIRAHDFADVDGALVFLDLDARAKQSDLGLTLLLLFPLFGFYMLCKDPVTSKTFSRKPPRCVPLPICNKGSSRSSSPSATCLDLALPTDQTGNVSEEVDSGVGEPIKLLESIVELKELKHLDSFTIVVNGLVMDSDINKYIKAKYYELCCSQNAFLHDHLPKVIGSKLVAGIISETVNIADAIAAGKLTTPHEEFSIWDRSLMAFEQLGMNVGFLRSRLQRLVRLAYESKQAIDAKRETLKVKAKSCEVKFHVEAIANWWFSWHGMMVT